MGKYTTVQKSWVWNIFSIFFLNNYLMFTKAVFFIKKKNI